MERDSGVMKPQQQSGRKAPAAKGRPLDGAALAEVAALVPAAALRRDLLIENLHRLNDSAGCLTAGHLRALAELMRLSQAEVYEVASFYHHFTIVKEGEPSPPLTLRVCDSISCMLAGAEALIDGLGKTIDPEKVRVLRAPCMGRCAEAPAACLGRREISPASAKSIAELISAGNFQALRPDYTGLAAYRAGGGYALLADCLAGRRQPEDIIAALSDAALRGMGGAGFPAGRKWAAVRGFPAPRYVTVNGDEGEPGTFKDRHYLERDPHRMLEGALVAAWAVQAERIVLYIRDEYPAALGILAREIAALKDSGLTAHAGIELRRGAGAYVCGEESAMLESIEGKRGLPRHRPPYIAEQGLNGRPTLNHNVETLHWVRDIVEKGAAWFAGQGRRGAKGLRSFSVSGRVRLPGVKPAPAGITLAELIDEHCGGMAEGHALKAFLPGGASGGIFPAGMADLPLEYGSFEPYGGFVGSHAVIVLSQHDSVRAAALNLIRFFAHESCGQCTPCRSGTEKMAQLLGRPSIDSGTIHALSRVMRDASICGLGQAAPNPVEHLLKYFPEEAA